MSYTSFLATHGAAGELQTGLCSLGLMKHAPGRKKAEEQN